MANDKEINPANTQANVTQDAAGKNGCNRKRSVVNKSQEVPHKVVSNEGNRANITTKGMANDKEINPANTQANVTQDAAGKNGCNRKRSVVNKSQEVPHKVVSNEGNRANITTKGMANDKEINPANTQANVTQDAAGKNGCNRKRSVVNKSQEVPHKVVSNEGITPQEPSATKASEDEVEVLHEGVSLGKK
nr:uncharacterized protein LOC117277239 [Nicotiana tomentosiformis]